MQISTEFNFIPNDLGTIAFLIPIKAINEHQIDKIKDYLQDWIIKVDKLCLFAYIFMFPKKFDKNDYDNLLHFLTIIVGIKVENIYFHVRGVNNDLDLDQLNINIMKNVRKNKINKIKEL